MFEKKKILNTSLIVEYYKDLLLISNYKQNMFGTKMVVFKSNKSKYSEHF